ncbi:MAG: hypothetical protein ACC742_10270 [Thermoanaerobaculales bacterium]
MRTSFFLVSCLGLLAVVARAQAPTPVAERVATHRDVATRLTLFSNQMVVVTLRNQDEQTFMRRFTLPMEQYMIYLKVLEDSANELGKEPISSSVATSTASVEITLHVGHDAPRRLVFSPMASVSLPLARIMGALDDLEAQVFEASPSSEELRTWEPHRGDRVQLFNGAFARVIEVWDDGIVVLEHEDTFVREIVPAGRLDQVVLHVVDREP